MTRTYYRGASGCIVLFDITNRKTLTEAKTWKEDLDSKVLLPNGDTVPCLLLANKVGMFCGVVFVCFPPCSCTYSLCLSVS